MQVGDTVRWHIRPEVHVEHGGYLSTKPLTGTVRSVHRGHVMVGTGRMVLGVLTPMREMRYAVALGNPSLKRAPHTPPPFLT